MIPTTQREAWACIKDALARSQWTVWEFIAQRPGSTRNEIDAALGEGKPNANFSRRLTELEQRGVVRRGDPRPCAVSGFNATTWWPVYQEPRQAAPRKTRAAVIKRMLDSLRRDIAAGNVVADPVAFEQRWRSALDELEADAA